MLRKLLQLFVVCLFPPFCCSCQKLGSYLCPQCYELVVFHPFPFKLELDPLYLDSIEAPLELAGPIPSVIHALKYKSVKPIASVLARILFYTATVPPVDVVTSVPLHPRRLQDRGFNQAEEMAIVFAQLSGLPYQPLLIRSKASSAQAKIADRQGRLTHLQQSFQPNPLFASIPPPKRVLLIDDVVTTGTTLNECAKVLKKMGVAEVHGLAVAHGGN